MHLGPEGRVEQHEFRRHEAGLDDLLVVIDVVEEDVDRLHALDAAALHELPFGAVENARHEIEGDQPLGRAAFAIDREGDAEPAEQLLGRRLLGDQGLDGEIVEQLGEVGIGGSHRAVGLAHLIKKSAGRCRRLAHPTLPLSSVLRQVRPVPVLVSDLYSRLGALLIYGMASSYADAEWIGNVLGRLMS